MIIAELSIFDECDNLVTISTGVNITNNINKGAKQLRAGPGAPLIAMYGGDSSYEITCSISETEYKEKVSGNASTIIVDTEDKQFKICSPIILFPNGNLVIKSDSLTRLR